MRDLAASVAPVVRLAPVARMPPRLLAVPVGPAEMPAWLVSVPRVWLVLTALWCRATVAPVAAAVLVALAETAAPAEPAGMAVVVPARPAGLVSLPRVALAVSVALAVRGLMRAV